MSEYMDEFSATPRNDVEFSERLTQLMRRHPAQEMPSTPGADWSTAPREATHHWMSPTGRRVWFKLGEPHHLAKLRHGSTWVADVNYWEYWLRHPSIESRPTGETLSVNLAVLMQESPRFLRS
ncbi:hypothetical protein EGJ27_03740 [Pseudomonas sp. v388]|uniref:hypothetical protein n=1 Tax=Pseudomonas sp. v388 TaxID=2479849 RepID=UPI000F7BAC65|nr:hypothetical protein [Pseudomonas sp. v388]RRV10733.1 hypothetical protein EGJ27_03740 [Pseudomonas sp. v388]